MHVMSLVNIRVTDQADIIFEHSLLLFIISTACEVAKDTVTSSYFLLYNKDNWYTFLGGTSPVCKQHLYLSQQQCNGFFFKLDGFLDESSG